MAKKMFIKIRLRNPMMQDFKVHDKIVENMHGEYKCINFKQA